MTRLLSETVTSAKTTRTRRRLSSQRNPSMSDGEAMGPINISSSAGFMWFLLSRVGGDQTCFSNDRLNETDLGEISSFIVPFLLTTKLCSNFLPCRHPVAESSLPKRSRVRPRTRPLPDPHVPKRPPGRPKLMENMAGLDKEA